MKEAEFIVIPKREGVIECEKHRTISIMSQVAKIVLKVIGLRLKGKVEQHVDEEQYGFRKGKGTRDAILVLRSVMERAIEKQRDLFMCFVDNSMWMKNSMDLGKVKVPETQYWC